MFDNLITLIYKLSASINWFTEVVIVVVVVGVVVVVVEVVEVVVVVVVVVVVAGEVVAALVVVVAFAVVVVASLDFTLILNKGKSENVREENRLTKKSIIRLVEDARQQRGSILKPTAVKISLKGAET